MSYDFKGAGLPGVIFLANLELGYLTPPVGLNLYLAASRFEKPLTTVVRTVLPFLLSLAVSVLASLINFAVALVLRRAARAHRSATLEANAHHLLTDVWTSAGVLVGVLAVVVTGRRHFRH